MLDKALDIVRKSGPVLPVEVGSKLGVDSFVASAYLTQLVEAGKLKSSKEPIGGTFLFFLPGQERTAQARVQSLLAQAKKKTSTFAKDSEPVTSELTEKRRAFAERLKEIEEREAKEKKSAALSKPTKSIDKEKQEFIEMLKPAITIVSEVEKPKVEPKIEAPKVEPVKEEPKPVHPVAQLAKAVSQLTKPRPKPVVKTIGLGLEFLESIGAEIIDQAEKKRGKELDLIVNIPSNLGPLKVYVKIRDKKSINEADLSLTYTEGLNRKLPILFITCGRLTKTAKNYLKVIGGLLKVKILEEPK